MPDVIVKGTKVPPIGLGTWQLAGERCYTAVRTALDLGYRHIDTAELYGNESEVGRALRDSGVAREAVFLTTKVAPSSLAPKAARRSAEESLRRLGVSFVDLLLVHWPNPAVPLAATLETFAALRAQGKTRHIGVSNFPVSLLREAIERLGADLLCNQVEYHPYLSQRAVLAATRRYDMMLAAYAPVARGRVLKDATLVAIGRTYGKSPIQIALRWLVDQDGVCAIPKASSAPHLAANIDIFDFTLSAADRAAIDALAGDRRIVEWPGYSPAWDPS